MRKRDLRTRIICKLAIANNQKEELTHANKGIYYPSESFFVYIQKSSDVSQRGR